MEIKIKPLFKKFLLYSGILVFIFLGNTLAFSQQVEDSALQDEGLQQSTQEIPAGEAEEAQDPSVESNKVDDSLVTVNFEDVDIRDAVKILADKAGVNMVVGPDVAALVNLRLANVTWEKALDVILKTYNLTYKTEDNLIRIMTLDQLTSEDEKVPLVTRILTFNFAKANEIKGNFQNMLGARGRIDVNDRTNSIIITDIPDNIQKIELAANELDSRTPQVVIEALMVDVVVSQDDQLGINWDLVWPDTIEAEGADQTGRIAKRTIEQSFGALAAPGGIIKFGTTLLTNKDLHATIVAWQQQSRVKILAHPQIMTLDNLTARINLTEEIPYKEQTQSTESSSAVVSTSFKEAGITLEVTPHITTKDNYIYLKIDVKQSFRSGFTPDSQPIIDSRAASTNLLVRNQETAVIGGLRKSNDTFTVNKIPLLGDIPMIGSAFRKRVQALSDTDLMIFVTPTIVRDPVLSAREKERLNWFKEEADVWVDKLYDKTTKKDKVDDKKTPSAKKTEENLRKSKPEGGHFYLRPPVLEGESQ